MFGSLFWKFNNKPSKTKDKKTIFLQPLIKYIGLEAWSDKYTFVYGAGDEFTWPFLTAWAICIELIILEYNVRSLIWKCNNKQSFELLSFPRWKSNKNILPLITHEDNSEVISTHLFLKVVRRLSNFFKFP